MRTMFCIICSVRLTAENRNHESENANDMCTDCWDYAGWENFHSDNGHEYIREAPESEWLEEDRIAMADCRVCRGDEPKMHTNVVTKSAKAKTREKGTGTQVHQSHIGHGHELTPAARAKCRKEMAARKAADIEEIGKLLEPVGN